MSDEADELNAEIIALEATVAALTAENAAYKAQLTKEFQRHRRAVTIGGVPIEWCAACTKKRFPCAVRQELAVGLSIKETP